MPDKLRIGRKQGARDRLRLLGPEETAPVDAVTAVCVIPFTRSGQIVAISQPDGVDIPGGHVKVHEVSLEETARRETEEEAALTLEVVIPLGFLESPVPGEIPGRPTYIAFATALVRDFLPFATAQASQRHVLAVDEFLSAYSSGDVDLMRHLVQRAWRLLFGPSETGAEHGPHAG